MNFRTALGMAVTIVMTSATLLVPAAAGAQETTAETSAVEASAEQTTSATEETTSETTSTTAEPQDPGTGTTSDPGQDLQDLSNDLSNTKDKDKDGSAITRDDKGAIESVGSVTTDTVKFIGVIVKVLAGAAGLMALLGKAFPAVKDMIRNIARGGHL